MLPSFLGKRWTGVRAVVQFPKQEEFVGLGGRSAQVYEALRSEIRSGIFGPGSKLPTEHELCARFDVSRPTVRKAVQRLSRSGVVSVRAGAGMFVRTRTEPPATAASKTLSVMYHYEADSLRAVQGIVMDAGFLLCTYSQKDWWWDPQQERKFLEAVKAERRRALIAFCSPREPRNDDLLAELDALGTRVVHIEPFSEELPAQSYVMPDYEAAGAAAATEFLLAGCKSVAYLPMNASPFERLLERGFARALTTHGSGYDAERDRFVFQAFEDAQSEPGRALRAFLADKPRPVGILCRAVHNAKAEYFWGLSPRFDLRRCGRSGSAWR